MHLSNVTTRNNSYCTQNMLLKAWNNEASSKEVIPGFDYHYTNHKTIHLK